MTLRQLCYFKDVAELEHYTQAAQKSFVSQSTLSHAIQELESELNVELFTKRGRNVELTKYGKLFLPYVLKSLETLETGIKLLDDALHPETGNIVISGFPSLSPFLSNIAVCYASETGHTGVHFRFDQVNSYSELRQKLLEGTTDLVFSTEITDPQMDSTYIGDHQLVLLVSERHRLASRRRVNLRELEQENFIAFDASCQLRTVTEQIFRAFGFSPTITAETAQDLVVYGLVAANHGIAIIPYPLGGIPYHTKVLTIANRIPSRKIYLIWNKERYLSPVMQHFRDYITDKGQIFQEYIEAIL